ncbi:MAG: NAD(P)H-hydrate dehydratase [Pseudomonadota bacterium]
MKLYRAEQVREIDALCLKRLDIVGHELMQRAGLALFKRVQSRFADARSLSIVCGGGNNAGDGYVLGALARAAGYDVQLIALKPLDQLQGDAQRAAQAFEEQGGTLLEKSVVPLSGALVVDAMLGTGLDRAVDGLYLDWIDHINGANRPVIAVDVPSGLNADTGMPMGGAVRADLTVSVIGQKRGLITGLAGDYVGVLEWDGLGAPDSVYSEVSPDAYRLHECSLSQSLPPRQASTHKGDLGHVVVAGGDDQCPGAVHLAARAALMTGSGLVSVATRHAHALALAGSLPEAMWANAEAFDSLDARVDRADVIALGPGLGQSDWSVRLWHRLTQRDQPIVLDADGLNWLQQSPRACTGWVLTPHPGEAARLLQCSTAKVQQDRYAAVRALAQRFDAVIVLKGAGTLIADPAGQVCVCPYGNPAMATAGMGDALTGIIASLIGQGQTPLDAAINGVLLHALAGDHAAVDRRQILATELIDALPAVLPR